VTKFDLCINDGCVAVAVELDSVAAGRTYSPEEDLWPSASDDQQAVSQPWTWNAIQVCWYWSLKLCACL